MQAGNETMSYTWRLKPKAENAAHCLIRGRHARLLDQRLQPSKSRIRAFDVRTNQVCGVEVMETIMSSNAPRDRLLLGFWVVRTVLKREMANQKQLGIGLIIKKGRNW